VSTDPSVVVEIHVPLTPMIGLPEGEDPFPWIDEVMDFITEIDDRGEAALYDDGGEFGDVYVFLINAAPEERLLGIAARIADLRGCRPASSPWSPTTRPRSSARGSGSSCRERPGGRQCPPRTGPEASETGLRRKKPSGMATSEMIAP
jgi:hypothetical protein